MTRVRSRLAAAGLLVLSLISAGLVSSPAVATVPSAVHVAASHRHHSCTRTSSGSCIRGGEFCPRAAYHHSGYDAKGRRYVCKGSYAHPHWELP